MLTILAGVAEFEREIIRERTLAGVRAAKAAGKTLGRPRRVFRRDDVTRMRAEGQSWRAIAAALNVPLSTLHGVFGKSPQESAGRTIPAAAPKATAIFAACSAKWLTPPCAPRAVTSRRFFGDSWPSWVVTTKRSGRWLTRSARLFGISCIMALGTSNLAELSIQKPRKRRFSTTSKP